MAIYLEIGCHATTHRVAYGDDRAAAERELEALKPKLGKDPLDRFDRNAKHEDTHTISSPTGDVVVVPAKIEVARVLDTGRWNDLQMADYEKDVAGDIETSVRKKRALKAVDTGDGEPVA